MAETVYGDPVGSGTANVNNNGWETVLGLFAVSDVTAPSVGNLVPADLSTITVDQAIVFDVLDETALIFQDVLVEFADGTYEVVWDGTKFSAQYSASSSRVTVSGGFRFSIVRGGTGWLAGPTFKVNVVDAGGNAA